MLILNDNERVTDQKSEHITKMNKIVGPLHFATRVDGLKVG